MISNITEDNDRKLETIGFLILITVVLVVYISTIRDGHDWGGDFAQYIYHAANIVDGEPYADIGYIYNPNYPKLGPKTYPIGYPLLLVPVIALFGQNIYVMKLELILMFAASIVFLFLLLRQQRDRFALVSVTLLAFSPYFWNFKDEVRSDLPFLLWVLMCFYLLELVQRSDISRRKRVTLQIFAGIVMYLAYATRTLGVVLPVVFVITALLRERKFTVDLGYVLIPFLALFLIHQFVVPSESSYFDQLGFNAAKISYQFRHYFMGLAGNWAYDGIDAKGTVLRCIIGVLALIGYFGSLFKKLDYAHIFLPIYMASIIVWPSYQFPRFLIPVFPLAIVYTVHGVEYLARIIRNTRLMHYLAMTLFIIGIGFIYIAQYNALDLQQIKRGIHIPHAQEFFEYIRENTDEDDVFIFRKPRVFALYTQRSASVYAKNADDAERWAYFAEIGADYLVDGQVDLKTWKPFLERSQDRLEVVFKNKYFVVYRIIE